MKATDKSFIIGYLFGALLLFIAATVYWPNTDSYKLGKEVQKVIDICEEKLPRNEKCTFLIVPESKLIYGENE